MKEVILILFLGLIGSNLCAADKNEADNVADSSVTSYSTVVIHHPHNKKSNLVKDGQEGRSQSYFKVKRLRASTLPPSTAVQHNGHNAGDFRPQSSNYRSKENELRAESSDMKQQRDNDFKPSQYLPEQEIRVSFRGDKDQAVQAARATEYRQAKEQRDSEFRKNKYNSEEQVEREPGNWRQQFRHSTRHEPVEDSREADNHKTEEGQYHREVFRHNYDPKQEEKVNYHSTKVENFPTSYNLDSNHNGIPSFNTEIGNPFEQFAGLAEQRLKPIPPPGMSEELIETLLSQQPQTFDSEKKPEPKKKSKSQTFKVGYSIGFGGGDDVVMGRPKDVRLHVNGKHSVWKSLPHGVEMSEDIEKKKPMSLKIQDSSIKASDTVFKNDNVLKNDVYYMQNYRPDTSVPTYGRTTFNHEQALTNSNPFDFSNAVDPKWFKQPRALDMGSIYQSLGYPPPLPVVIPGGPRGEGTMVHAIVIPIESIGAFDNYWPAMHQMPMIPLTQSQPVEQALTLSPVVTAAPIQGSHLVHPSQITHHPTYSNVHHSSPEKQQRFKTRVPKAKDSLKQGSYNSAPIVVAPAPPKRQAELQEELNNILAEEMMRKNQRLPAVGLRPPPQF